MHQRSWIVCVSVCVSKTTSLYAQNSQVCGAYLTVHAHLQPIYSAQLVTMVTGALLHSDTKFGYYVVLVVQTQIYKQF